MNVILLGIFTGPLIKRQASGTSSDNEWYSEWQRVVQRMTTSSITSDNERQRLAQRVEASESEWEWF